MGEDRYFVDCRVGCVAVRDRIAMDDTPGLHRGTQGVIHFWPGVRSGDSWEVPQAFQEAARLTCDELNRLARI